MFKIYELWISLRYLRSRRDDGFVSIVGWFSLIGIALGVATLIIVMSVMNGFRDELLTRIIGLNGHASLYFSDKERTSALTSICSLLNVLLPESQPNKIIYVAFERLLNSINVENWIFLYIFFEINLIKELGYDTNLKQNFKDLISGKELINIKIDGNFYEVPEYLITEKIPENFNNNLIRKSLYFTRQIMVNKFFVTNNLLFPKSRVILENYFN